MSFSRSLTRVLKSVHFLPWLILSSSPPQFINNIICINDSRCWPSKSTSAEACRDEEEGTSVQQEGGEEPYSSNQLLLVQLDRRNTLHLYLVLLKSLSIYMRNGCWWVLLDGWCSLGWFNLWLLLPMAVYPGGCPTVASREQPKNDFKNMQPRI